MISTPSRPTRQWWPWPVFAISYPLSGLLVSVVLGPVSAAPEAAVGGGIVGLALGAAGSLAMRTRATRWVPATMAGLILGTIALVTVPVVGPAVQGLVLGAAQSLARPPLHPRLWIPLVTATWTAGWAVSWVVALSDEQGVIVFGASGAILATAALFAAIAASRRSAE